MFELMENEKDAPWDDFFPLASHGQFWNGWPIRMAKTLDGKEIEVYFPNNDISKLKFVLRGG